MIRRQSHLTGVGAADNVKVRDDVPGVVPDKTGTGPLLDLFQIHGGIAALDAQPGDMHYRGSSILVMLNGFLLFLIEWASVDNGSGPGVGIVGCRRGRQ